MVRLIYVRIRIEPRHPRERRGRPRRCPPIHRTGVSTRSSGIRRFIRKLTPLRVRRGWRIGTRRRRRREHWGGRPCRRVPYLRFSIGLCTVGERRRRRFREAEGGGLGGDSANATPTWCRWRSRPEGLQRGPCTISPTNTAPTPQGI